MAQKAQVRSASDFTELSELVVRARDEKEDLAQRDAAFNQIVRQLQDFAVGAAYSCLRDIGLAEDAAQESFLIAWRRLPSLQDPRLFVAWLKQIILSQCHRVLRKKSGRFAELGDESRGGRGELGGGSEGESLVSRKEEKLLIRDALEHLPERERAVLVLFYFSGQSHAAIAGFLGIPQTTVVKRLYSARQRLKAALAPLRTTIERARPSRNREFAAMVRAGIYDDYVGVYRYDERPELEVKVERVGNRLVSHSAGQKNTILLGARLAELRAKEFDGRAEFVRGKSGKVTHFIYYEFGKRMGKAKKVE
jgi:RNA polymerase sigma factor (sigma-70 family)